MPMLVDSLTATLCTRQIKSQELRSACIRYYEEGDLRIVVCRLQRYHPCSRVADPPDPLHQTLKNYFLPAQSLRMFYSITLIASNLPQV